MLNEPHEANRLGKAAEVCCYFGNQKKKPLIGTFNAWDEEAGRTCFDDFPEYNMCGEGTMELLIVNIEEQKIEARGTAFNVGVPKDNVKYQFLVLTCAHVVNFFTYDHARITKSGPPCNLKYLLYCKGTTWNLDYDYLQNSKAPIFLCDVLFKQGTNLHLDRTGAVLEERGDVALLGVSRKVFSKCIKKYVVPQAYVPCLTSFSNPVPAETESVAVIGFPHTSEAFEIVLESIQVSKECSAEEMDKLLDKSGYLLPGCDAARLLSIGYLTYAKADHVTKVRVSTTSGMSGSPVILKRCQLGEIVSPSFIGVLRGGPPQRTNAYILDDLWNAYLNQNVTEICKYINHPLVEDVAKMMIENIASVPFAPEYYDFAKWLSKLYLKCDKLQIEFEDLNCNAVIPVYDECIVQIYKKHIFGQIDTSAFSAHQLSMYQEYEKQHMSAE